MSSPTCQQASCSPTQTLGNQERLSGFLRPDVGERGCGPFVLNIKCFMEKPVCKDTSGFPGLGVHQCDFQPSSSTIRHSIPPRVRSDATSFTTSCFHDTQAIDAGLLAVSPTGIRERSRIWISDRGSRVHCASNGLGMANYRKLTGNRFMVASGLLILVMVVYDLKIASCILRKMNQAEWHSLPRFFSFRV